MPPDVKQYFRRCRYSWYLEYAMTSATNCVQKTMYETHQKAYLDIHNCNRISKPSEMFIEKYLYFLLNFQHKHHSMTSLIP